MEQHHFDIILEQLIMIERNTRKEEKPLLSISASSNIPQSLPILSFLDEAFEQVQKTFFDELNAKTGWGRNEIKQTFTKSVKSVRTPIVEEDLPWQR